MVGDAWLSWELGGGGGNCLELFGFQRKPLAKNISWWVLVDFLCRFLVVCDTFVVKDEEVFWALVQQNHAMPLYIHISLLFEEGVRLMLGWVGCGE